MGKSLLFLYCRGLTLESTKLRAVATRHIRPLVLWSSRSPGSKLRRSLTVFASARLLVTKITLTLPLVTSPENVVLTTVFALVRYPRLPPPYPLHVPLSALSDGVQRRRLATRQNPNGLVTNTTLA